MFILDLVNRLLSLRSKLYKTKDFDYALLDKDSLVFKETFRAKSLNLNEWKLGMEDQNLLYHPVSRHEYYDHDSSQLLQYDSLSDSNALTLDVKHDPKTFYSKDLPSYVNKTEIPDEYTLKYKADRINSIQYWKYGIFRFKVKMPEGKNLWPAIWLSGHETWPPEIDICEGYSGGDNTYSNWLKFQPNVHYKMNGEHKFTGPTDIKLGKYATDQYVEMICHWTDKFIKIYYDGMLVYKVKNKKIIDFFNEMGPCRIILNNSAYSNNCSVICTEPMTVTLVEVYKLK